MGDNWGHEGRGGFARRYFAKRGSLPLDRTGNQSLSGVEKVDNIAHPEAPGFWNHAAVVAGTV
jgi:hypothetical protein